MGASFGGSTVITSYSIHYTKLYEEVLPAFDNDPTASAKEAEGLTLYKGAQAEQPVGVAIKTFTDKGFSGYFSLMVGFLPDGSIHNISVLDQKETPGLGSKSYNFVQCMLYEVITVRRYLQYLSHA